MIVCENKIWSWCKEPLDIERLAGESVEKLLSSHGDDKDKSWKTLKKKIRDDSFLNGVANAVKMYCKHDRFGEILDQNPNIIACTDQVFNLKGSIWEPLTPEHHVSKTTRFRKPGREKRSGA